MESSECQVQSGIKEKPLTSTITVLLLLSIISTGYFAILPALVGGMIDYLGFSAERAGRIVTAQMAGAFLMTIAASLLIHRWNLRTSAMIGLALLIVGDMVCGFVKSYNDWLIMRFITGIGAGLIWCSIGAVTSRYRNPDAIFGILLGFQFLFGAVSLYFLPHWLPQIGINGLFFCYAAFSVIGLISIKWLPTFSAAISLSEIEYESLRTLLKTPIIIALVSAVFLSAGESGLWTYWERVGMKGGLKAEEVGLSLSLSQIGGLIGGLLATLLGKKFGRKGPIGIGITLIVGSVIAVFIRSAEIPNILFVGATFVIFACESFVWAYFFGLFSEVDPCGRVVAIGNIMLNLGMVIGPGLASILIRWGYAPLFWMIVIIKVLSVVLILAVRQREVAPAC